MNRREHVIAGLGSCALLVLLGCGSDADVVAQYSCELDPELVAEQKSCLATSNCPCGSRCEFGRCVSECASCADAGLTCTPFGSCAESSSGARLELPDPIRENFFVVSNDVIELQEDDLAETFVVRRGNATESLEIEVRVEHPQFRVSCDLVSTTVTSQCKITLDADTPSFVGQVINLAATGESVDLDDLDRFSEAVGPTLFIASKNVVRSIPIEVAPVIPEAPGLTPGVYRGTATLTAFEGNDASGDVPTVFALPVRMVVGEPDEQNRWSIAIDDSAGIFGVQRPELGLRDEPSAVRTGALQLFSDPNNEDDYQFTPTTAREFVAGSIGTDTFALGTRINDIRFVRAETDRLRFDLQQALMVTENDGHDLEAFWRFNLDRDGSGEIPAIVAPDPADAWLPTNIDAPLALELSVIGPSGDFGDILQTAGGARGRVEEIICGTGDAPGWKISDELAIETVTGVSTDLSQAFYDGELYCESLAPLAPDDIDVTQRRWPLFPLLTGDGLRPDRYDRVIDECLTELENPGLSPEPACIDTRRWFAAVVEGLERARSGSAPSNDLYVDQRLASYLVARYLDIHGFLAHLYGFQRSVRRHIDDVQAGPLPSLLDMASRTPTHWDSVLHPRVLMGLVDLALDVHENPDYRPQITNQDPLVEYGVASDIHTTPVALAFVSDIVDQTAVWNALANDLFLGRLSSDSGVRARESLSAGVRRSFWLYVFAAYIHRITEDNRNGAGVAPEDRREFIWEEDFQLNSREAVFALGEIVERMGTTYGERPELSLPWNRIGDQSGAGARFRAMSEVILGAGAELGGVLGFEFSEASRLRDLAFSAYGLYRLETLTFLRINNTVDDRQDYVANRLGSSLAALCGYSETDEDPRSGYEIFDRSFDSRSCFVDPACLAPLDDGAADRDSQDPGIAFQRLCRVAHLSKTVLNPASIAPWIRDLPSYAPTDASVTDLEDYLLAGTLTYDAVSDFFRFQGASMSSPQPFTVPQLEDQQLQLLRNGEAPSLFSRAELYCESAFRRFAETLDDDPAVCQNAQSSEGTQTSLPTFANGLGDSAGTCNIDLKSSVRATDARPECYRGEIGVAFKRFLAERANLDVSQAELAKKLDQYAVSAEECAIRARTRDSVAGQYDNYLASVKSARETLRRLTIARSAVKAAADIAIATTGLLKQNVTGKAGYGMEVLGTTTVNVAEGVAAVKEIEIDNVKDDFEADKKILAADTEVALCFNALNKVVAGLEPAYAAIRTAATSVEVAAIELDRLFRKAEQKYIEGRAWRANIQKRRIASIPQTYSFQDYFAGLDRIIERTQSALLFAKRAVEFELQQSVVGDEEILGTFDVSALREIAYRLKDVVRGGRVAGGNPSEGRIVLSLRDDILRIPRTGEAPTGFHDLSESVLLREGLLAQQFATYDGDGVYVGQSVPFALSPFVVGDRDLGIDVTAGLLCAERVWSVGAVLVGRDSVGLDQSRLVPLFLRKRNAFYSQTCTADPAPMEGFIGFESGIFAFGSDAESAPDRFTSAWLNTTIRRTDTVGAVRAALEKRELFVNLTQELAGLGLYGDYQLFVPAEAFSADGVDLDEVEDVLFVFDIVAATNNSRF